MTRLAGAAAISNVWVLAIGYSFVIQISSFVINQEHPMEQLLIPITIFVLAIFIGFEVITKVPSTLHTPLMSGSNAISGITIIGAILCSYSDSLGHLGVVLGVLAVVVATINVVGGYVVTNRMLRMFKSNR
jgi:NAD(P) transhydrogenase subunit alpha